MGRSRALSLLSQQSQLQIPPQRLSGEIFPAAGASEPPQRDVPRPPLQGPGPARSLRSPAGAPPLLRHRAQQCPAPASSRAAGNHGHASTRQVLRRPRHLPKQLPRTARIHCPFPPRSCSSAPGGSDASQAAAGGTAIYYLLLLIIFGFKFIYYVCKNGNTLASECLLGIQYPYYSKWFFLHN